MLHKTIASILSKKTKRQIVTIILHTRGMGDEEAPSEGKIRVETRTVRAAVGRGKSSSHVRTPLRLILFPRRRADIMKLKASISTMTKA